MKRGRSTTTMTKEEKAWVDRVKRTGCVCCWLLGHHHDEDGPMVEAHHLLSGGIRIGHLATIGLCSWHHRGQLIMFGNHRIHREQLGPALSEGSGPFHDRFGEDDVLMGHQRVMLGLDP